MSKDYWEQDQIKYSETEVRYAINKVVGGIWGIWFWPLFNRRFWVQERVAKCLEGLKPHAKIDSTGEYVETKKEMK